MSETPGNAQLEDFLREQIPHLAVLYDRIAYALDPFDPGRDIAEQTFNSELANWFDNLPEPKPTFREFRRHPFVCAICMPATSRHRFDGTARSLCRLPPYCPILFRSRDLLIRASRRYSEHQKRGFSLHQAAS